ncbi:MAG: glycosylhydrolase-like jelly roll fold domain-containing protein [Verrucomicrobiia bacterium]
MPDFAETGQVTRVSLELAPHQSFFVVFDGKSNPRSGTSNFTPTQPLLELTGCWEVSFDPRWGGPDRVTFEKLEDWSKRAEPGIKFYSGKATYRTTFELPDSALGKADSQLLVNLGDVKNMARIVLNGTDLGVLWCPPWQADISGAAKAGLNNLEITIANLWPNRLIRDSGLSESERLTATTWNPFQPGDQLLPSGLLGPVRLLHRTRLR